MRRLYSPSFQADVLSVGVLRRSGTIAKFGKKPRLVTKNGNVVPLRTMGGLFYLDLVDGLPPAQTMTARAPGSGVSYVEMFAGRGAMAKAAQNCGGNVVLLVENEEVAVDNLQRDFPNAIRRPGREGHTREIRAYDGKRRELPDGS